MQQSGRNPTRRNRNIGTAKSGHGQENRLVIPRGWNDDRIFYEKLSNPVEIPVSRGSINLHILVEPPLDGFYHACTVDDIIHLLELIPESHFSEIENIVLRQPKRKERILRPVWGRMVYWARIGKYSGPSIYLDSQDVSKPLKWSKSLGPDAARELERLRNDGHTITTDRRHHLITVTIDSLRTKQLFRTLPHEIGHYVDFLQNVVNPSATDYSKWDKLVERYDAKPVQEKEAFAHRYADEFKMQSMKNGTIPFERIVDEPEMKSLGLDPKWFKETS